MESQNNSKKKSKYDWTKTKWAWFLDKFVIAAIFVGLSAVVNYWSEIKKTEYALRVKTAENATSKTRELWEAVGKYRASLERINRLKRERNIKSMRQKPAPDLDATIEKEINKSKQLEDEVEQKVNLLRAQVGKTITEHVIQYKQLLKIYHDQLDSLMFENWPKQIDLSPQFKKLDKTAEYLYQMEMSPEGLQQYVEQQFMR